MNTTPKEKKGEPPHQETGVLKWVWRGVVGEGRKATAAGSLGITCTCTQAHTHNHTHGYASQLVLWVYPATDAHDDSKQVVDSGVSEVGKCIYVCVPCGY